MTKNKQNIFVLANAIVWAAVILATSLVMADADKDMKSSIMLLQFVGWFSLNLTLVQGGQSVKEEWACVKRLFSKSSQA